MRRVLVGVIGLLAAGGALRLAAGQQFDPITPIGSPPPIPAPAVTFDPVPMREFRTQTFSQRSFQQRARSVPSFNTREFEVPVFQTPSFEPRVFEVPVFDTPVFEVPVFEVPQFRRRLGEQTIWSYRYASESPDELAPITPTLFLPPHPIASPSYFSFHANGGDYDNRNIPEKRTEIENVVQSDPEEAVEVITTDAEPAKSVEQIPLDEPTREELVSDLLLGGVKPLVIATDGETVREPDGRFQEESPLDDFVATPPQPPAMIGQSSSPALPGPVVLAAAEEELPSHSGEMYHTSPAPSPYSSVPRAQAATGYSEATPPFPYAQPMPAPSPPSPTPYAVEAPVGYPPSMQTSPLTTVDRLQQAARILASTGLMDEQAEQILEKAAELMQHQSKVQQQIHQLEAEKQRIEEQIEQLRSRSPSGEAHKDQVMLRFQFIEIGKPKSDVIDEISESARLILELANRMPPSGTPWLELRNNGETISKVIDELAAKRRLRIKSSPQIVTVDGRRASVNVGGEVTLQQALGKGLILPDGVNPLGVFVKTGLQLDATPTIRGDSIDLDLDWVLRDFNQEGEGMGMVRDTQLRSTEIETHLQLTSNTPTAVIALGKTAGYDWAEAPAVRMLIVSANIIPNPFRETQAAPASSPAKYPGPAVYEAPAAAADAIEAAGYWSQESGLGTGGRRE